MEHTGYIGLKQLFKGIGGEVFKFGPVLHPRVVHEDINSPMGTFKPINGGPDRIMICGIESQRLDHCTLAPQCLGSRVELALVPTIQNDRGPGRGQPLSQRKPDPLRRSGDQRAFGIKRKHVYHWQPLMTEPR
jgi:hypothetical protein